MKKELIYVTTAGERLVHWLLGGSCIFLGITGLGMMFHTFAFIAPFFGGYGLMKLFHNFMGLVFGFSVVLALGTWFKEGAKFEDYDIEWVKKGGGYLWKVKDLPEPGRFNAGQKAYFILVVVFGAVMVITGLIMWFPLSFPHFLVRLCYVTHALGVVVVGGSVVAHIFLGTANPGTIEAMMHGYVTRSWVKLHHGRWLKEVDEQEKT